MLVRASSTLAIVVLVLVSAVRAQSQADPVLVGPIVGVEGGALMGSIPVYAGSSDCGLFESGSTFGTWGGGRLALPTLFGGWGMQATVAWSYSSGTMSTLPVDPQFIRSVENGELVELDRRYKLQATYSTLRFDLLGTVTFGERWRAGLGPSFVLLSSTGQRQIDTLLGPGRTSFADGQRSQPMNGGVVLRSEGIGLDAVGSLGYALPVGKRLTLLPEVRVRLGITSMVQDVALRSAAPGASLALLFDLSSPPPPPDTALPPRTPLLAASIDLRGVDATGKESDRAMVTVDEILSRRYVPLLPAVFFDQNSATPAPRYLLSDSVGTLTGADNTDPMAMHLRLFQIIGERMQSQPSARLTLFGSTAAGESPSLGRRRAIAVRDEFVKRWGIEPGRIVLGSGDGGMRRSSDAAEDGRAENRRVVIASNSPDILAPFIVSTIERSFDPPAVVAHPTMRADAGVRRWEVVLRQAEVVVQRTSSDNTKGVEEMTWTIEAGEGDTTLTPLSATLEVEDSTGARLTAHDEMPVSIRRRTRVIGGRGEERADSTIYTLVAFDYNDVESDGEDRQFLEEVVATLSSGDQVRVIGFTDRLGDPEYNAVLSRRRAQRIETLLRTLAAERGIGNLSIAVEGEGVNESRFTNDLPEGRIFSRGVQLSIAHPRD